MRACLSCFLAVCFGVGALSLDLTGKWVGDLEIKLPDSGAVNQPAWAEFVQKGQEITGSAGGGDSDESSPLEKVTFDGTNLAFQFTGPDSRIYKAKLVLADGDRLDGTLEFTLPDGTPLIAKMTLKRHRAVN